MVLVRCNLTFIMSKDSTRTYFLYLILLNDHPTTKTQALNISHVTLQRGQIFQVRQVVTKFKIGATSIKIINFIYVSLFVFLDCSHRLQPTPSRLFFKGSLGTFKTWLLLSSTTKTGPFSRNFEIF